MSFTYDRYGNRTAQTVTAGSAPSNSLSVDSTSNHLTNTGFSYDANGNMTNDGTNSLVYDAENHLLTSSGSGGTGGYLYDGNGLRVEKCVGNCSTATTYAKIIYSGGKPIAEDSTATGLTEYIYSGGALLATIDSSGTRYHHPDHLSPRVTTDSSGNVIGQQGHYPFGESWYAASTTTKYQFTSYERDSESGNDYAQARYNINRLGRFASPDPISGDTSDPQSLNRYAYVRNMPIAFEDPSGMVKCATAGNFSVGSEGRKSGGPSDDDDSATASFPQAGCGYSSQTCNIDGVNGVPCDMLGGGDSYNVYQWQDPYFPNGGDGPVGGWSLVPLWIVQNGTGDQVPDFGPGGGGFAGPLPNIGNLSEPTPPNKKPDCFADLKFRPVGPPAPPGATHSFWYVTGSTGTTSIISGGPSNTTGTGTLKVWVTPGSQSSRFQPDNPSATTHWTTGSSPNNCDSVDKLIDAANHFPNGVVPYNFMGPNSNSAARELGAVAGFNPPTPPPGAVGWSTSIVPH